MKVIRYHTDNGFRSGLLVKTGPKWTQLMMMDLPIKIIRVLNTESKYFTELDHKESKTKRIFRDAVKKTYGTIRNAIRNAPKNVREALR